MCIRDSFYAAAADTGRALKVSKAERPNRFGAVSDDGLTGWEEKEVVLSHLLTWMVDDDAPTDRLTMHAHARAQLDGSSIPALELRGWSYYKLGEFEMAQTHFREGLKFDPEHRGCKDGHKQVGK